MKDKCASHSFTTKKLAHSMCQVSLIVKYKCNTKGVLLDFSLTVKAAALIFIIGCGSAISSAKEGKSGFIYNLVKS